MEKSVAHYDRTMNNSLVDCIKKSYPWIIEHVKNDPELDFQTGQNKGTSWFSIYRGTGRVLTFRIGVRGHLKITAHQYYMEIAPDLSVFDENLLNESVFNKYVTAIKNDFKLGRYYITNEGKREEGYYQNLIGRRYTFNTHPEDEFVIIDKELVLGFDGDTEKKAWNAEILDEQKSLIEESRKAFEGHRFPKDIKKQYGEFDFMALDWEGNFIIMELKQDDPQKTSLSPFQCNYYYRQFQKLLAENRDEVVKAVKAMINQKVEMGIISIPAGRSLPEHFACGVKTCVIVGEDNFSKEIRNRFKVLRKIVRPDMAAYSCSQDGTLIPCSLS